MLWLEGQLALMGEVSDRALARVGWVRTILPGAAALTIRNYCRDADERDRLLHYARIEELNEMLAEKVQAGERTLIEITNSYRMMYGHRPLAISLKLVEAARGHAEEMSALGYFSHTSPNPKRKTPSMRMQLAGYDFGVSENIALGPSAEGAHIRWLHSSGHHRNLLNDSHTEFGIGNSGTYWVQNFGRGEDYLAHEDFPR